MISYFNIPRKTILDKHSIYMDSVMRVRRHLTRVYTYARWIMKAIAW